MQRRIFIGDIQGCREELERLLEALRFDAAGDRLHPCGDLVNRGPDSLGVLRLLKSLGAGPVLGNHDLHLLRVAAGLRRTQSRDTLAPVLAAPDREELLAWLGSQPFLRSWDDLLLVHAGLSPAWDDPVAALAGLDPLVEHPASGFATLVRHCNAAGQRPMDDWPPPRKPFAPWYVHWTAQHGTRPLVVFGHWARQGLVTREGVRGLDTGCVWGGKLTAWIAEEDRTVQVPASRAWAALGPARA